MAIQFIDNQPLTFIDNFPTGGECLLGQFDYCTKYQNGDRILAQWKITPCDPRNLICNNQFLNNEPEGVMNPTMLNGTNWTPSSANWFYDATYQRFQSNGVGVFLGGLRGTLTGISSGYACEIKYTIGGNTGGTIVPRLRGTAGTPVSSPGTYRETIISGSVYNEIRFDSYDFDGWIDDVSVKYSILYSDIQGSCWASTDFPERWSILDSGCIKKIPGIADNISNAIYGYTPNIYVKMTFNVSNLVSGTMLIKNNGSTLFTIDQNGYYEKYFNMSNANIEFHADALFDGTLCNINLISYEVDAHVDLVSLSGGPTYPADSSLYYYEDRLMFNRFIQAGIQNGCYQVCLTYTCPNFSLLPMYQSATFDSNSWEAKEDSGNTNILNFGSGLFVCEFNNGSGANQASIIETSYCFTGQPFYEIHYSITTGIAFEGPTAITLFFTGCNYPQDQFLITSNGQPNTTYTGIVTTNCQTNNCGYGFRFYCGMAPDAGARIEVTSATASIVEQTSSFPVTYCSNCIEIKQHHSCSLWVGGWCGEDSFGFKFNKNQSDQWQIGARIKAVLINPKYNGELKRYNDCEGNIKVTKATSNKIYEMLIDYVDERSHDWLRTAFLCDTIEIGDIMNSEDYFVGTDGDYEPEWPSTLGNWNLAQSRVNLQRKIDPIYNNNAG